MGQSNPAGRQVLKTEYGHVFVSDTKKLSTASEKGYAPLYQNAGATIIIVQLHSLSPIRTILEPDVLGWDFRYHVREMCIRKRAEQILIEVRNKDGSFYDDDEKYWLTISEYSQV